MANFAELVSIPSDQPAPFTDKLQLTLAAYLPAPNRLDARRLKIQVPVMPRLDLPRRR